MRLNFSNIFNGKIIKIFFVLIFANLDRVNSGLAFENCLLYDEEDFTSYDSLLNYSFSQTNITSGGLSNLCCNKSQCSPKPQSNGWCHEEFEREFICTETSLIFCTSASPKNYWTPPLCGGIIGDTPITNNITLGDCASYNISLATVADYLANLSSVGDITNIGKGYAYVDCSLNVDGLCANIA